MLFSVTNNSQLFFITMNRPICKLDREAKNRIKQYLHNPPRLILIDLIRKTKE